MFTVEMDHDEISIQILDDNGSHEDVGIFLYVDYCFIRQWDESKQKFNVVTMSPQMFYEFVESMKKSEGTYVMEKK